MLLLDALYPPAPDALVADCQALGAAGCWAYIWRPGGCGSWSADHVAALRRARLRCPAIVVPGDNPPPAPTLLSQLPDWEVERIVACDFEWSSEPSNAWWDSFRDAAGSGGWRVGRYGTTAVLGQYDPEEDEDWIASWLRSGVLEPIPTLPTGWYCWQFVNDVLAPSGARYDVSVVDPSYLGLALPRIPLPQVNAMRFLTVVVAGEEQQHLFWSDDKGVLQHWYWTPAGGWNGQNPTGANALVPFGPLDVKLANSQVHVVATRSDGRAVHCYQTVGSPTWNNTVLG